MVSSNETQLVVFDLDFTLWDCGGTWCDCLTPPFNGYAEEVTDAPAEGKPGGRVVDSRGAQIRLYPDVEWILNECEKRGIEMGIASRTEQPKWAAELLERLKIRDRFQYEEIYPTRKTKHFGAIQRESGVELSNMVFFDDEIRNIHDISAIGVHSVFVERGINRELFENALNMNDSGNPRLA
ncbi:MAG: magnesium-dependent phosphatase-1 [Aureliella sp.]